MTLRAGVHCYWSPEIGVTRKHPPPSFEEAPYVAVLTYRSGTLQTGFFSWASLSVFTMMGPPCDSGDILLTSDPMLSAIRWWRRGRKMREYVSILSPEDKLLEIAAAAADKAEA